MQRLFPKPLRTGRLPQAAVFFRLDDSITFLGHSMIDSITDELRGRKTPAGNPITDKIAKLKEYHEFGPPRRVTSKIEQEIKSLPGYNNQLAILPITKELFEMILLEPEPYSIDKLKENTMIASDAIEDWEDLLNERKQIIFYGPPGTGKTYVAIEFSRYLISKYGGEYKIVQFHPSYSYEEFIEGIKPNLINGQINYEPNDGIFKILATSARRDPSAPSAPKLCQLGR
jgi:AAA domain (dynein-related subfamily)